MAALATYLTRQGDRDTMRCLWELYGPEIDHVPFLEALMDGTLEHVESIVLEPAVAREEDPRITQHEQMRLAG